MAIDMTTVKAISYNNKDVIKIEDSLGHVIWQVAAPAQEKIFFTRSNGSTPSYVLENNTLSNKTWGSGTPNFRGNRVWSDGTDLFVGTNSSKHPYKLDPTTDTWEVDTTVTMPNTNDIGNSIWSDGTDIFYSNGGAQLKYNKATKTWDTITWTLVNTGAQNPYGNCVVNINGSFYYVTSGYVCLLDTVNLTSTKLSMSGQNTNAGYTWWTDGNNIYQSMNGTNCVVTISGTLVNLQTKTWYGFTNINGARIIKYNGKIIAQDSSSPYGFYELDIATDTWTPYTFDGGVTLASTILDQGFTYDSGRWSGGANLIAVATKH